MVALLCLPAGDSRAEEKLTIAVAASLVPVFRDMAALHRARQGNGVTLVVGSSGKLSRQIENGAPFDLFASADESWIRRLTGRGLIAPGETLVYAEGRVVLLLGATVAPFDQPGLLSGPDLARLAEPDIHLFALANPLHAPYGKAAQEALVRSGLWERLQPKRVFGENVRQALQYVQSGNVDAGLIALSLVNVPQERWRVIDPALHRPLRQTLGIVRASGKRAEARQFMELLQTPAGRETLLRYGYKPVNQHQQEELR